MRPALADVNWAVSDGTASYHALQFSAQKRLTHGLSGLLSYTWGHSIDTVGQSFGGGADGPLPQDPLQSPRESRQFAVRHRHRLTIAGTTRCRSARRPLADRRQAGTCSAAGRSTASITFQTGLPFTPTLNATTINTGTGQRPDRIADGKLSDPTVDRWFDTVGVHDAGASSPMAMRAGISCTARAA